MFSFSDIDQVTALANHIGKATIVLGSLTVFATACTVYLNHVKQDLQVAANAKKATETAADKKEKQRLSDELAETKRAAKEDRDARLAIEAKLAPRKLTTEQRAKLLAFLTQNKSTDPFTLEVAFEADDGVGYFKELLEVFQEGQWSIKSGDRTSNRYEWGICLIYKQAGASPIPSVVRQLENALTAAGIHSRIMGDLRPDADFIPVLYIGMKTPP